MYVNISVIIKKVNIMEKFGLVDKTKEELIEIALEQDSKEKKLSEELEVANEKLAHVKDELKKRNESVCMLCLICMMMMACLFIFIFNR